MVMGLIGRKVGMTRIVADDGRVLPVTVIHVAPNTVAQVKDIATDGYCAVQVATGTRRPQRVTSAVAGHFRKSGIAPGRLLREFRVADTANYTCGMDIDLDIFAEGQRVDVSGVSKGKGFAGAIKRHNFRSNRASHGNSLSHRAPGSIGCRQTPGRVFKGKKMAGHLGAEQVTTLNLELVRIDANRRLLMIKGAVPGARDGDVMIRPAVRG
ncbi:50S ribosomal protein L3 [Acidithiobacillus sp. 'AMD consortium']|uniref:Large ribosomal subunit protein uL3 n=2 Tax=Acidithiobacillus ferridurans TaxID=1232575 RepID=A0A8X8KAD4_ACIFI|nr:MULTISPECIES: 50S ribosomal protein L3 [Acidithiobacillus]MBU2715438.1 50S ribosomal protein L3 [Acidithiobacillus ferridurans]MBU2722288.1 50S ribosomal protein L3 [Acidithiobacillus ferridurans]MBU2727577.1 50S ribosomal protein L3 [Acidithiobacillus ferridurans]MBU2731523.1 50S ribosomal protein L3 [Acidithiobacillus ferridurans]QFG77535.1 50S ribosomal protein L3 [Acidithiobacillus sp. 'AMD consortium']